MHKKSHKKLCKTSSGSIMEAFSSVLAVIAIGLILVFYVGWMGNVTRKDNINMIARKYLLQMETYGKLENTAGLTSELQTAGLTDINLAGTTTTQQTYGGAIYLTIAGNLKIENIGFDAEHFKITNDGGTIPISISLTSTAKC